jgi:hypothetical protein
MVQIFNGRLHYFFELVPFFVCERFSGRSDYFRQFDQRAENVGRIEV